MAEKEWVVEVERTQEFGNVYTFRRGAMEFRFTEDDDIDGLSDALRGALYFTAHAFVHHIISRTPEQLLAAVDARGPQGVNFDG